jgi:hypothetical protein
MKYPLSIKAEYRVTTIQDADGELIAHESEGTPYRDSAQHMMRLVACANACAGIEDPAILRAQREALLTTCKNTLDTLDHAEGDVIEDLRSELRTVIARAEGRAEAAAEEAEYIRRERAGLCPTCGQNKAGFKSFASGNFQGECEPCFNARRSA